VVSRQAVSTESLSTMTMGVEQVGQRKQVGWVGEEVEAAASISLDTSSGLSTVGRRLRDFGNGMYSARKCRRSVFTNKKRNADTYWLTVAGANFLAWNRCA
jgi:hypothetical protein